MGSTPSGTTRAPLVSTNALTMSLTAFFSKRGRSGHYDGTTFTSPTFAPSSNSTSFELPAGSKRRRCLEAEHRITQLRRDKGTSLSGIPDFQCEHQRANRRCGSITKIGRLYVLARKPLRLAASHCPSSRLPPTYPPRSAHTAYPTGSFRLLLLALAPR